MNKQHEAIHHAAHHGGAAAERDPVCGMSVDPQRSPHYAEHEGRAYHFCSAHCRSKFLAEPGKYLNPAPEAGQPEQPAGQAALYTCPMHPEIRQDRPGSHPVRNSAT